MMTCDNHARAPAFADANAARQAVQMAMPMIEQALHDPNVGESGFLYIVIMDPTSDSATDDFQNSILYEHAIGDPSRWDADYAGFARDKAKVTWRTHRDSHSVRSVSPHLLRTDDCGVWGSACVDGIVVGVSGANPWYDEAFAGCIAHCLKALAKARALAQAETPRLSHQNSDLNMGNPPADLATGPL